MEEEEKVNIISAFSSSIFFFSFQVHKYIIQVTLLRKSWPLTPTQWQFVEQLKEQEKNELKSTFINIFIA